MRDPAQRLSCLVRVLRGVVRRDRIRERSRRTSQERLPDTLLDLRQIRGLRADARGNAKRFRELEHIAIAGVSGPCGCPAENDIEVRGEPITECRDGRSRMGPRDLHHGLAGKRQTTGERLEHERPDRVLIRGRSRARRIDP